MSFQSDLTERWHEQGGTSMSFLDKEGANDDADGFLDDEDDEDEDDEPPAPCVAPDGYRIVAEPPPADALEPRNGAQEILVGQWLLYRWARVGWCVGAIKEANGDRRRKIKDVGVINFFVHYEIDDNTSAHMLELEKYGADDVGSWVLLEELESEGA